MGHALDILAPKKKPEEKKTESPKRKNPSGNCLLLLVVLIFAFLLASALQNPQELGLTKPTITPVPTSPTNSSTSGFELFDNSGGSSLTQTTSIDKIRLVNASENQPEFELTKQMLIGAGYRIEQATTAQYVYETTTIFYRSSQEAQMLQLKEVLKKKYQIDTQVSENLADSYDFLVIIGKK